MYNLARMRILTIFCLTGAFWSSAQLPETVVTDRTLVIMDLPLQKEGRYMVRGDWKSFAQEVQSKLVITGVDAIGYIHAGDWDASTASMETYRLFFATREVKNIMRIEKEGSLYRLIILDYQSLAEKWSAEGGSISQAIFRLGKEIKRLNYQVTNFLTVEQAEIFTDIPFSRWTASTTYPDQIKRLTLGIDQFDDPEQNARLKELLTDYPFQYELFDYTDDEDAFRKGYQYVLLNMTSAGSSVQKLLNYRNEINQTDFISTVKGDSTDTRLKTIPAEAQVTKFYFRQTVNQEIFVGRNWDADVSWDSSLENFLLNLRIAFKKL